VLHHHTKRVEYSQTTSEQIKCKYSVVSSCLLSWYYSTTREPIASKARGMYDGYTTSCTSTYRRQQCSPRSLVPNTHLPSTTFSFLSFKFKGHTVTMHACKPVKVGHFKWTYKRLLALTCYPRLRFTFLANLRNFSKPWPKCQSPSIWQNPPREQAKLHWFHMSVPTSIGIRMKSKWLSFR